MRQAAEIKRTFLKVDSQAGYLRLALWAISLFIIWSLFAYLSAIVHPLQALPDLWPTTNNGTSSLAADLWQDVLGNYFSAFTLLNLALLFLLSKAVISAAAYLLYRALELSAVKSAQRFLLSCLFSVQDYPLLDASDSNFHKTDTWKILTRIGGPCYLMLEPNCVILTQDNNGNACFKKPQVDSDNIIFFSQGEKAIQVITLKSQIYTLNLQGMNKTGRLTGWRNLRISCNFTLEEKENHPSSDVSPAAALRQFFNQTDPTWEKQIEEMLELETSAFLLNYTTTEIRTAFNMEKPASFKTNLSQPAGRRSHQTAHHSQLYPIPGRFFRWQKQGGFLRRRRRSLLPELRLKPVLERMPEPPATDFKGELKDHLSGIFKTIYNIPINIEINNIGEIQFNGEN